MSGYYSRWRSERLVIMCMGWKDISVIRKILIVFILCISIISIVGAFIALFCHVVWLYGVLMVVCLIATVLFFVVKQNKGYEWHT